MANTLRALLNRLRWDRTADEDAVVLDVHFRESDEDRTREVPFEEVVEISGFGVTLADGTLLPYHRVLAVRGTGHILWCREGSAKE